MADAKLILKPPHMEVRMKPGYWPDLPKMEQTIKDAGYTPIADGVVLRVRGKAVAQGDGVAIELEGMKTPLTLPVVAAKDDPDTAAHLKEHHLGQTVDVEGLWQPGPDAKSPGTLAVTAINDTAGKKHTD